MRSSASRQKRFLIFLLDNLSLTKEKEQQAGFLDLQLSKISTQLKGPISKTTRVGLNKTKSPKFSREGRQCSSTNKIKTSSCSSSSRPSHWSTRLSKLLFGAHLQIRFNSLPHPRPFKVLFRHRRCQKKKLQLKQLLSRLKLSSSQLKKFLKEKKLLFPPSPTIKLDSKKHLFLFFLSNNQPFAFAESLRLQRTFSVKCVRGIITRLVCIRVRKWRKFGVRAAKFVWWIL